jgi:hypothetical protein
MMLMILEPVHHLPAKHLPREPEEHLEDLQKARVLWWRKQMRISQPSGEQAGIRALLSRIDACRAEGARRFARVSAVSSLHQHY